MVERAARFALNVQGFESRTLEAGTSKLHVYDAAGTGELPTTVVLHGMGSGATSFGRVLTRLRPHTKRVVAPDLPGHGFSAAPTAPMPADALFETLCELLAPLQGEPLTLVIDFVRATRNTAA
jgi:pimeloyl-ACP methyl ester carboxylesterase